MTLINHSSEQTYHIYRTRKHVRIAFNPTWVFQHGFKDLWFIAYEMNSDIRTLLSWTLSILVV